MAHVDQETEKQNEMKKVDSSYIVSLIQIDIGQSDQYETADIGKQQMQVASEMIWDFMRDACPQDHA